MRTCEHQGCDRRFRPRVWHQRFCSAECRGSSRRKPPPDPDTLGPRDFDWLTGGRPIGVWLQRLKGWRSPVRTRPQGGPHSGATGYRWSVGDVDRLLDELWPPVEWPDLEIREVGEEVEAPESVDLDALHAALVRVLATIPAPERLVVSLVSGLVSRPATLEEAGAAIRAYGNNSVRPTVTKTRAGQLWQSAIEKLRHPMRRRLLEEELSSRVPTDARRSDGRLGRFE